MSYNQGMQTCYFCIPKSNFIPLATAILTEQGNDIPSDLTDEKACKIIKKFTSDGCWNLSYGDDGCLGDIEYYGDRACDSDRTIFDMLAPFVKKGSYIQMVGEDDALWRWVFNGERCVEDYPEIKWQDPETL